MVDDVVAITIGLLVEGVGWVGRVDMAMGSSYFTQTCIFLLDSGGVSAMRTIDVLSCAVFGGHDGE